MEAVARYYILLLHVKHPNHQRLLGCDGDLSPFSTSDPFMADCACESEHVASANTLTFSNKHITI